MNLYFVTRNQKNTIPESPAIYSQKINKTEYQKGIKLSCHAE